MKTLLSHFECQYFDLHPVAVVFSGICYLLVDGLRPEVERIHRSKAETRADSETAHLSTGPQKQIDKDFMAQLGVLCLCVHVNTTEYTVNRQADRAC